MATAILGACSSDPDPAPATTTTQDGGSTVTPATPQSEAGAANQAQACKTLPRDLKGVKPTDYFAVMTSDQAAVDLLTKRTGLKFLPPGSDFQKRGEALTAPIYEAFKKLYPETVEGMPGPPRIVIADDASFNAAAWGDMLRTTDGKRQAPWVFKFNKGAFVDGVTDSQLSLIAAHELGHLLLRPSAPFFKSIYYRETPDEQGKIFGEYEPNDAELEKFGSTVVQLGARTGQLFATQLNGYVTRVGAKAFDGNSVPLYARYASFLATKYGSTTINPTACQDSDTSAAAIGKIIGAHFDSSTNELDLGADAAQLDALTKAYQTQRASCLSHVKISFLQLAYDYRVSTDPGAAEDMKPFLNDRTKLVAYLELLPFENDYDVANPTQNILTKLFAISTKIQDAVQKELDKPDMKPEEIRVFTPEDDADEAAVRIAKLMSLDGDDLIIGLMSQTDPTYLPTCQALVAKGEVPAYGGFIDTHHTNCWRLYRNAALKRALASCPASWPK